MLNLGGRHFVPSKGDMNHHPGIGMNHQSGIGIGIAVSVEHYPVLPMTQLLPSSAKPQQQPELPAAAKLAELQSYFVFHLPPPPRASRFFAKLS